MNLSLQRLPLCLLLLRLSVFLVMFMWTLDKFVNPTHAAAVFEKFYAIPGVDGGLMTIIATVEMLILAMFLVGFQKTFSYGFVLVVHSVSTLSAFSKYLAPFEAGNLLFFAAWPMLAACAVLFLLRSDDHLLAFDDL